MVPDFDVVKKWAKTQEEFKAGESEEDFCSSADVNALILKSMNDLATANKFNGLERVKQVYLHHEAFSESNNLLTPSQKLKRNVSAQVFRSQIDALYAKQLAK